LAEHGAELRGHRVIWRKDATDYQKQLVNSPSPKKNFKADSKSELGRIE